MVGGSAVGVFGGGGATTHGVDGPGTGSCGRACVASRGGSGEGATGGDVGVA